MNIAIEQYPQINIYKINDRSPEKSLARYLKGWQEGNWQSMYDYCQLTWKQNKTVTDLKQLLHGLRIVGAEIQNQVPIHGMNGNLVKDIEFILFTKPSIRAKQKNKVTVQKYVARLICESVPFKPDSRGTWGVNPISVLRKAH